MTIRLRDRGLDRALRKAVSNLQNLAPIWDDIGQEAVDSIQKTFDHEGRPEKWIEWSTGYGNWRAHKKPGKILTISGRLRNSITYEAQSTSVIVGTNTEYAATHNFGDKKRGIPQREFMVIQDSDWPKFISIIEEHILGHF